MVYVLLAVLLAVPAALAAGVFGWAVVFKIRQIRRGGGAAGGAPEPAAFSPALDEDLARGARRGRASSPPEA